MHCRSNSRENTDLRSFHNNWQSERETFWGLGYRSGSGHNIKWNITKKKKRRVTCWHSQVCYFWFLSHKCWFFCPLFDTIFQVCFLTWCTSDWSGDACWYTPIRHEVSRGFSKLLVNNHVGGSEEHYWHPNPAPQHTHMTKSRPVQQRCVTGLLFSACLLPCSASRSNSNWPKWAEYHSDPLIGWPKAWCPVWGEDMGGSKLRDSLLC